MRRVGLGKNDSQVEGIDISLANQRPTTTSLHHSKELADADIHDITFHIDI